MKFFYLVLKSARPRQWLKNLALYAALVFTGQLFVEGKFATVTWAVVVFTLLTGAIYIFNDVLDIQTDRLHPFKRKRPIASGRLPVKTALMIAGGGFLLTLFLANTMSLFFFLSCLGYMILHLGYSIYLKRVPIVDVMAIASGFIIRVYAGAFVIDSHMNVWFLLTVVSAALFLAVGKRRSEMTLLTNTGVSFAGQRNVLSHYTPTLLDVYTGMFANTTWLTYALFSFLQPPLVPTRPRLVGFLAMLPRTLTAQKLLMITVPLVIYGVMRYLQLIYEKNEGESPERVLLSDKPLLMAVLLWGLLVFMILYLLN